MATAALGKIKVGGWSVQIPQWIVRPALMVVCVAGMWGLWQISARPVTVEVDGVAMQVQTHRHTVGDLLLDLGLQLNAADRVTPDVDTPLREARTIQVARARPVQVIVDGRTVRTSSWGDTPRAVLEDAGIPVDPYDQVSVNGRTLGLDDPLPRSEATPAHSRFAPVRPWERMQMARQQMRVVRAVPIVVDDGGMPFTVRTTAQTVGEALREAELTIYLGDRVVPSVGSEIATGLRVTIQRSVPVELAVDGRTVKTRTRGETVADALSDMRVGVAGLDQVEPDLDTELYEGIQIQVTRIKEEIEIEEEIAHFETLFEPDPNLAIDTQELVTPGAEGITRTRYRVRYENGEEVTRKLEDTWVAQEPSDRVIAYGQEITPKTMTTADGREITYWRKIRMRASSYSANTAGVSPESNHYGQTYTGDPMRHGIVAVDPSVIPLRSEVYVPEYGMGEALDTGSAIRARRIDLGYDDSNLQLWNSWVDVYVLWPPPSTSEITWVLPNWPRPPE